MCIRDRGDVNNEVAFVAWFAIRVAHDYAHRCDRPGWLGVERLRDISETFVLGLVRLEPAVLRIEDPTVGRHAVFVERGHLLDRAELTGEESSIGTRALDGVAGHRYPGQPGVPCHSIIEGSHRFAERCRDRCDLSDRRTRTGTPERRVRS